MAESPRLTHSGLRLVSELVTVYCQCGDWLTVRTTPRGQADRAKQTWLVSHPIGVNGHGPATSREARRAREEARRG